MAVTDTLKTLIRFKSVSGKHEEARRQFDWIKGELEGLPVFVTEHEHNKFQSMVITTQPNTKSPKVWLAAHLDVVDGSADVWEPKEEDGTIKGRGAFDMKFAAACYLEFFKEMGEELRNYDIGIMFTTDEEIGGFNGTRALIEEDGYRGDVVFLPDGGNVWKIEERAKGIWRFTVTATGKEEHSSRPWDGESATEPLIKFLAAFCELGDTYKTEDEGHWHLSYSITMMNGGVFQNLIAANAQAVVDVRFTTDEEVERFQREVNTLLETYPLVSLKTIATATPFAIERSNTHVQSFRQIVKEKTGIECGWNSNHGGSDARYFMPYNIPVILFWPKAGDYHTENEWIDVADLHRLYDVMKAWTLKTAALEVPRALPQNKKKSRRTMVPSPVVTVGAVMVRYLKTGALLPKKALAYIREGK